MRKRVALARALVSDPQIVLYDEPTTGLDPITTDYVDGMILNAKRALGITSMVISHDIASAFKVADRLGGALRWAPRRGGDPRRGAAEQAPVRAAVPLASGSRSSERPGDPSA